MPLPFFALLFPGWLLTAYLTSMQKTLMISRRFFFVMFEEKSSGRHEDFVLVLLSKIPSCLSGEVASWCHLRLK